MSNFDEVLALAKLETARRVSALANQRKARPLHPAQEEIFTSPARFRVLACGRRFGKTELAKWDSIETAIKGKHVWWISPTYNMALDVWRILQEDTKGYRLSLDKGNWIVHFHGGGLIRVRSGKDPDALRGSGLDSVVIDEAAFCSELVWETLRPALSDKQGKALLLSTPKGLNWFFRLYQRGLEGGEWQSWKKPSSDNPLMTEAEMAQARLDLPDFRFREEYLADFSSDYGSVFMGVMDIIREQEYNGESVVFGIDWGRTNDFSVITVLGETTRQVYEVNRFTGVGFPIQRQKIEDMYNRWKPSMILAEQNSFGAPNIEEFQMQGIPIQPWWASSRSKQLLIENLALGIQKKEVWIPHDTVLIDELLSYEISGRNSQAFEYNAPKGKHDDTVISLALAYKAIGSRKLQIF